MTFKKIAFLSAAVTALASGSTGWSIEATQAIDAQDDSMVYQALFLQGSAAPQSEAAKPQQRHCHHHHIDRHASWVPTYSYNIPLTMYSAPTKPYIWQTAYEFSAPGFYANPYYVWNAYTGFFSFPR